LPIQAAISSGIAARAIADSGKLVLKGRHLTVRPAEAKAESTVAPRASNRRKRRSAWPNGRLALFRALDAPVLLCQTETRTRLPRPFRQQMANPGRRCRGSAFCQGYQRGAHRRLAEAGRRLVAVTAEELIKS
jgi:hypothetical protein